MKQDALCNENVEELEKVKQLLNEAYSTIEEAAKIFCSILHNKDECYEKCLAKPNEDGWDECYVYDAFSAIELMLEKIDFLKKLNGQEGEQKDNDGEKH